MDFMFESGLKTGALIFRARLKDSRLSWSSKGLKFGASEEAWSALEAVIGQHEGFGVEFLSDESDGTFERIKSQLLEWIQDIGLPADDDSGLWERTADTSDKCQELTSLRDTNLARVRATENTLKRRVPLAWEESGAENINFKLAVICTRSEDDIEEEEAVREFVGKGIEISTGDISVINRDIDNADRKGDERSKQELESNCGTTSKLEIDTLHGSSESRTGKKLQMGS
ncbi:hypothetical protein NHQ30_009323 [Ciborinia camelliae]|nr:hypothetical protein NHQ30_009323 [Ciborinia camelliae]